MKKLLFLLMGVFLALSAVARDFEYTYEGQTLSYTVIDEVMRTVKVKAGIFVYGSNRFDPGNNISGTLDIPSTVKDNNTEYTVTSIGEGAFSTCNGLMSVGIPITIKDIEQDAFWGCRGLTKADFASLESLCSIRFENELSNPLWYARHLYIKGEEIQEVTIPDTVMSIGDYAFYGAASLSSITLGNCVQTIGAYAFGYCECLSSITIPTSIASIGASAFKGCSGLTRAEFASIESLCAIKFSNYESNPICFTSKLCIDGEELHELVIPESVNIVGDYSFYGCSDLVTVVVADNVQTIGSCAFYGCNNLKSVSIGNSMRAIGKYAFSMCTGLTKAEFVSIESLCSINFEDNSSNPLNHAHNLYIDGSEVNSLTIPNSVRIISSYAFSGCTSLKSVEIGNSVQIIGEQAFAYCSNLTSLKIPDSVMSIDHFAFYCCYGLASLIIPDSVISIGSSAFASCEKLSSVIIGNGVVSIGGGAFEGCKGLVSVKIGSSVNSIGVDAFRGCGRMTHVEFASIESLCSIDFECDYSNPIVYSNNFYINEEEIKDLVIPDAITSIGSHTFERCNSLISVTLGKSMQIIGHNAFLGCNNIKNVYSLNPIVPEGKDCFGDVSNMVLYVHKRSKDDYKVADGWSKFTTICDLDDLLQLSLNEQYLTLEIDDTAIIVVTPISHPELMLLDTEAWTSDNETIATVENGVITAVGGGLAKITYSVKDKYDIIHSASSEVKVAYLKGDANGNGFLAVNDVVLTERGVVKDYDPALIIEAVDFNGDNILTVGDLTQVVHNVINYAVPNCGVRQNISKMQDQFSCPMSLSLTQNGQDIYVAFDSGISFTGIQFDVLADEDVTVSHVTLEGLSKQNHSEACHRFDSAVLRVIVYGTEVFPSNESFAIIHTKCDNLRPCMLTLTNVMVSDFYGNLYNLPDCEICIGRTSAVDNLSDDEPRISVEGRTIVITSRRDSKVIISDMRGNYTIETVHSGINRFSVHSGGVYTVNNNKIIIH